MQQLLEVDLTKSYQPRDPHQTWFHRVIATPPADPKGGGKVIVNICHRRAGKSTAVAVAVLLAALTQPGRYTLLTPFLKQSRSIFKPMIDELIHDLKIPDVKWNATDSAWQFPTGGHIYLGATEQGAFDLQRGVSNRMLFLDEAGFMAATALDAIIPTLADNRGTLIVSGTPAGINDPLYDYWVMSQSDQHPNVVGRRFPVTETNIFSDAEIEQFRAQAPSNASFQREWMCSFSDNADDSVISLSIALEAQKRLKPGIGATW